MSAFLDYETNMILEPPPGYLVVASPNDGESGTYACPYDGCDGVVCGSVDDCHAHDREWHAPPYSCAECGAGFAAYPALSRHIKASGHQRWACQNEDCASKGVEFDGHLSYHLHIMSSGAHRCLAPAGEDGDGESTADGLSECPSVEEFICLERCCAHYMRTFSTERMFDVHANGNGHRGAVKGGESLLRQGLSTADLEAKQEAMREFRCDRKGCPLFGHCLSTSHSYANHVQTAAHRFPCMDVSADQDADGTEDEAWQPQAKPSCVVLGCPQYGRQFSHRANHERHVNSAPHIRAARRSLISPARGITLRTSPRFKPSPPAEETEADDESRTFWSAVSSAAPTPLFSSPHRGAVLTTPTKSTMLHTPLSSPSSTAREEYLERRNRELEDELRRLHARLDFVSRQA